MISADLRAILRQTFAMGAAGSGLSALKSRTGGGARHRRDGYNACILCFLSLSLYIYIYIYIYIYTCI